jgi:hypothetical protein
MLAITERAQEAFRELSQDEATAVSAIRIEMMGFG